MPEMEHSNPYRGPFTFTSNDEDRFFGRKKETEELVKLIRSCQLTILFGTSGTGKTSLIQAKLLPQLTREYFHPIYLRINFESDDPLDYTRKRIVEELRKWQPDVPEFEKNQSLLNYAAKTVIFKGLVKPVLFFDQFEELFTLGPKNDADTIQKFINELGDLIELRLSDDLKNAPNVYNLSNFKVVLSLRQDWVAYLEDYSHIIPSVLENRYRLKRFSAYQAFEAIYRPAVDNVDEGTVKNIIVEIGEKALIEEIIEGDELKGKALKNLVIDPFVLSLYCYQLYEKSIASGNLKITDQLVSANTHEKLIRNYYDEKTAGSDDLKKLIEDKLLNESGKRLTLPLETFTNKDLALYSQFIDFAEATGVIRLIGKKPNLDVEIIHDQLAAQIFESRIERITKEKLEDAAQKEAEANRLRADARRAKKATSIVTTLALVIICAALIWVFKIAREYNDSKTLQGLNAQVKGLKKQIAIKDSIVNLHKEEDPIVIMSSKSASSNQGSISERDLALIKKIMDSFQLVLNDTRAKLENFQNQRTEDSTKISEDRNIITLLKEDIKKLDDDGNKKNNPSSIVENRPIIANVSIINKKNKDGSFSLNSLKEGEGSIYFDFTILNGNNYASGLLYIKVKCLVSGKFATPPFPEKEKMSVLLSNAQKVHVEVNIATLDYKKLTKGLYTYEILYLPPNMASSNANYLSVYPETKFLVK